MRKDKHHSHQRFVSLVSANDMSESTRVGFDFDETKSFCGVYKIVAINIFCIKNFIVLLHVNPRRRKILKMFYGWKFIVS